MEIQNPKAYMKKRLSEWAENVFSQFGEDGIIAKLFSVVGVQTKLSIEFGAWDGLHFSNTAALWSRHDWKAVLVEADRKKMPQLISNTQGHSCICVNEKVLPTGKSSIEAILARYSISERPDLLSIDIDGDDYYILEGLELLRPRVLICEYNPTIPPGTILVAAQGNYFGCSSAALVKLAEAKGYILAAMTDTNCIFLDKLEAGKLEEFDTQYHNLASHKYVTYVYSGYDGSYVLSQKPVYGLTFPSDTSFMLGKCYAPIRTISQSLLRKYRSMLGK